MHLFQENRLEKKEQILALCGRLQCNFKIAPYKSFFLFVPTFKRNLLMQKILM